jgi:hypothetical protein
MCGLLLATRAAAEGATATPSTESSAPDDANTEQARDLFRQGVSLVQQAKWAEALSAFEHSEQLRPHAVTLFNIGACERALGRYTRARRVFYQALGQEQQNPGQLAPSLLQDTQAFLTEIHGLLGVVDLTVVPSGSALSVDGRPLEPVTTSVGSVEHVAGVLPPGPGAPTPEGSFRVVLDPGAHVFTLRRKGYADAVVRRDVAPGSNAKVSLQLELLPATLSITANVERALVRVDGEDMGPVPVSILRSPGAHEVEVRRPGYDPYSANVTAQAGEQLDLKARLLVQDEPLTAKWWFWTGAAVVIAGGAIATYALTRPDEPAPPYDGGSTDWVARPGAMQF